MKETGMEEWVIMYSRRGKHKEYGYPLGKYLCKTRKDAEDLAKKEDIDDPVFENYTESHFYLDVKCLF